MNDITQKLRLIFGVEGEEKANTQVKSLDKSIMGLAKNIGLAAIAYKTFTTALDIGKKSLQKYNEQIIAMRQIESTLRSTGQAVNWTTQELGNMASELQNVSNFGDEEILKGATQSLLRFDGISKEIFPRVQALTVDMAEGMGSLENAAKTLGISLADPLLGMTRLRRAGVMFNETQQETIKGLVETGNKSEAQKCLLDALEKKYKGLALASATTTQQLKKAWSDPSLKGYNASKGRFFYGLKVHMVVTTDKEPVMVHISEGSIHDVTAGYQFMHYLPQKSITIGDKGYVSSKLEAFLKQFEIVLSPIGRNNMQQENKEEYFTKRRIRKGVETAFSMITAKFGKVIKATTIGGFLTKLRLFITAYAINCFLKLGDDKKALLFN